MAHSFWRPTVHARLHLCAMRTQSPEHHRMRIPKEVSEYMRKIGSKGGKNGKGSSKTRNPAHYKKMAELRRRKKS
jgi:hypothetical protein